MPIKRVFPIRLIFDYDFYAKFMVNHTKDNPQEKPSILTKLMYINANSMQHPRRHNVMSQKTFDKILNNHTTMYKSLLRSSFYPRENVTEIELIDDEIERNIKHAIDLTSEDPRQTIILTTPEKEETYSTNPHYIGIKEIDVRSGNEALELINSFWTDCSER